MPAPPHPAARRNGAISHWYREAGLPPMRDPLPGDRRADVCIVGGGFTGLWTAYYLSRAMPDAEIVVVEKEFCGFGASGRNGGWISAHFAGVRSRMARASGRESVIAMQQALQATIDEILSVAEAEGIEAGLIKPGVLSVARSPAQEARLLRTLEEERSWGSSDLVALSASELDARLRVSGARAALYSPHCARAQPAKLVCGLARAVVAHGVTVYEDTTVRSVSEGCAVTDRGVVRAPVVLRCLEGFTASLDGARVRRELLPLNSAMIVTDPLGDERWASVGWDGCELLGDLAHAYMYAQRTADGRIALGGRGVPYRFGSRVDRGGVTQARTIRQLETILHAMFPATVGVGIDHAWCGVLGVRRDWTPTVAFDPVSGLGSADGYVGSGVAATNLAARALVELVVGDGTPLTRLPWVRGRSRAWEPEPLRWLGARLVYGLYRGADRRESSSSGAATDRLARLASLVAGR